MEGGGVIEERKMWVAWETRLGMDLWINFTSLAARVRAGTCWVEGKM